MADSSFETEFLHTHNSYRKQHGAPPLTINRNLCRSAQAWAQHLLSIRTLKHSKEEYGENLYYAWSSANTKLTGPEAVESWYKEIKDYNFSRPGFSSQTGHFTQVVWKDTKELGIGLATDGNTTFVVGQYLPAGNISNAGYFQKNVLPAGSPLDSKSTSTGNKVGQTHGASNMHSDRTPVHPRSTATSPPGGKAVPRVGSGCPDRSFEIEFLQTHNSYRKIHGAPPLTINRNLCGSSQKWAEHLLSIRTLMHSNGDHGENVYYAWSSATKKLTGREAVESWYSEIKDYNFSRPGFSSKTGHFTQVVWKDTKELGVGLATDGNTTFVVGQYLPAGNISNAGYFEKNVLPGGSPVDVKSSSPADRVGQALSALSIRSNQLPSAHPTSKSPEHKGLPPPQSNGKKGQDLSQFRQSLLDAQNYYRQQHGSHPLSLCPVLSKEAQDWAAHLVSINTLKNSGKGHGEALSYKWTSSMVPPTGNETAESWYKEKAKYNFANPGFQSGAGNFTQMIWRSTEKVGVGLASDGKGMFITVAFYKPPGNIANPGYFQDNVKPAGK
ncbi:uncharacterized protein glipr2 [Triplophysa dalaica]|uniref:uncharacterized protein glipr2 n=1 Tax=Triplophysa dalaica TaxID=1582913 RepID=UPI0024DF851E|nr:uncharacterized protein glipr2 [Triplophysa dalaica]XP_056603220.1 uncharacterized protein glipr2 [Triplophysa dalaica]